MSRATTAPDDHRHGDERAERDEIVGLIDRERVLGRGKEIAEQHERLERHYEPDAVAEQRGTDDGEHQHDRCDRKIGVDRDQHERDEE